MSQQVYILEDKNSGLLKIGISVDVAMRVGQVNKEFGCDAEVIGVLDAVDALKTERFIHGMLKDCRVVGEWFDIEDARRGYLLTYFDSRPSRRTLAKPTCQPATWGPSNTSNRTSNFRSSLKEVLEEHGVKAISLVRAIQARYGDKAIKQATVYAVVKGRGMPDERTADQILHGLMDATGKEFSLGKLFIWLPDAPTTKPKADAPEREA